MVVFGGVKRLLRKVGAEVVREVDWWGDVVEGGGRGGGGEGVALVG